MDKLLTYIWYFLVLGCIGVIGFMALLLLLYIGGELVDMSRSRVAKKEAARQI